MVTKINRYIKQSLLLLLLTAFGLTTGCKPKPPIVVAKTADGKTIEAPPPADEEDEKAAEVLFDKSQTLESEGKSTEAQGQRDEIVKAYPGTRFGAQLLEKLARDAESRGDIATALSTWEKLLLHRPGYENMESAHENYARLLIEVGRYKDASLILKPLFENAESDGQKAARGRLLARALTKLGSGREAVQILVAIRALPGIPNDSKLRLSTQIMSTLSTGLSFADATQLWDNVRNDSQWAFAHPLLAYKIAKISYHVRDYETADEMLQLVIKNYGSSSYGAGARKLKKRLDARFTVAPDKVGVLLPLTGRFQQYGKRALEAVKLALGTNSKIQLVVKDTAGDGPTATKAVEDLVLEDHVIAIIGPLFSKEARAAALKAEEISVPILTLSHKKGLPEIGPYVFRTALTIEAQAESLAKVSFETLGFTNFALLYPRNPYGKAFTAAFWKAVEDRGGEIRGAESYEHNETTFAVPVRKLVGRHYMMARWDFMQQFNEIRAKKLPSHRHRAAVENLEKNLIPVIDFDAIVIPDSGRNIGLVAPALAFEDIVMTHDPAMIKKIKKATGNDNVKPIQLLGASTWNTPRILQSCENYCEDAIFVDSFFPDSPDPKVRDFVSSFHEQTGAEPILSDAQAYDTLGLLKWVLSSTHPKKRDELRKLLLNIQPYAGITGKIKFKADGEVDRELFTLTIQDHAILLHNVAEDPEG